MDIYREINELKEGQEKIISLLQGFNSVNNSNKIYDLVDLQEILHVSKRTLATWKSQGILPYSQIGKKCFVTQSALDEFLTKHNVKAINYGR